jgi:hypothetical protein
LKVIADLQARAGAFSHPLAAVQSVITLQVVYVLAATSPWRLIEIVRSEMGRRRRMLCFGARRRRTMSVAARG